MTSSERICHPVRYVATSPRTGYPAISTCRPLQGKEAAVLPDRAARSISLGGGKPAKVLQRQCHRHHTPAPRHTPHSTPIDDVRANLESTNYLSIAFEIGEEWRNHPAGGIAILSLDTDWYESTRHELILLYPKLSIGGILIIDDYGHWEGAKRAVGPPPPPGLIFGEHVTRIIVARAPRRPRPAKAGDTEAGIRRFGTGVFPRS